jgi:hypothetical protein
MNNQCALKKDIEPKNGNVLGDGGVRRINYTGLKNNHLGEFDNISLPKILRH